jgi:hypothetical protein
MSDTAPTDPIFATINVRIHALNVEIDQHTQALRVATAIRDELADLSETLSRKPRAPRKPRATEANGPGTLNLDAAVEDVAA